VPSGVDGARGENVSNVGVVIGFVACSPPPKYKFSKTAKFKKYDKGAGGEGIPQPHLLPLKSMHPTNHTYIYFT